MLVSKRTDLNIYANSTNRDLTLIFAINIYIFFYHFNKYKNLTKGLIVICKNNAANIYKFFISIYRFNFYYVE